MTEDQISELLTTLDQLREERDEAREIVAKCNNSLFGSYSYFTVLPPKNTTAPDAIENLKSYSGEQWRAAQAAEAELSRIKGERDEARREYLNAAKDSSELAGRLNAAEAQRDAMRGALENALVFIRDSLSNGDLIGLDIANLMGARDVIDAALQQGEG